MRTRIERALGRDVDRQPFWELPLRTLRQIKKRSRRAVPILIREFGFSENDFYPSMGGEDTIHAPTTLKPSQRTRHKWRGKESDIQYCEPLPGTMMHGYSTGYYEPEWDCETCIELLRDRMSWRLREKDLDKELARLGHEQALLEQQEHDETAAS